MTTTKDRSPGHDSQVIKDNVLQFKRRQQGAIQPLDPSDPRHIDHPSHEAQWRELARALGRAMADRDFDRLYG